MRRPRVWLRWLLGCSLLLVVGQYLALTRLVPRYVLGVVQYAAGGEIAAARAHLSFPLTTTLSGLRLVTNTPQSALTIQRAFITPTWRLSVPSKTWWVESVELDRPVWRMTRTQAGTLLRPSLPDAVTAGTTGSPTPSSSIGARPIPSAWTVRMESLKVRDGVIELVDEQPEASFRGVLDHLSFDLGPVTIPFAESPQVTVALRARLVGEAGHAAPLYCSGWWDPGSHDMQISCKLDPLALAALEPYYQGSPEVRVYETTLAVTSHWASRANELHARIQVELANLREGDLSIGGRTIVDVKTLASGDDPRLTAEISVTGPLDDPTQWRAEFLPGNEPVQRLVNRLLERGVEVIRLPFWTGRLSMSIVPASRATMTDIEAAAKEIREALEILAVPTPEGLPSTSVERAGEPPSASAVPTPAAPAGVPSTEGPAGVPSTEGLAGVPSTDVPGGAPPSPVSASAPAPSVEPRPEPRSAGATRPP